MLYRLSYLLIDDSSHFADVQMANDMSPLEIRAQRLRITSISFFTGPSYWSESSIPHRR